MEAHSPHILRYMSTYTYNDEMSGYTQIRMLYLHNNSVSLPSQVWVLRLRTFLSSLMQVLSSLQRCPILHKHSYWPSTSTQCNPELQGLAPQVPVYMWTCKLCHQQHQFLIYEVINIITNVTSSSICPQGVSWFTCAHIGSRCIDAVLWADCSSLSTFINIWK